MHARLQLSVWPAPAGMPIPLGDVETAVIVRFTPPINLDANPGKLPRLSTARAARTAQAAAMAARELNAIVELEITATPRETLVWAPSTEHAAQLRHELVYSG